MYAITAFAHSLKINKQVKEAITVTVGQDRKIQTAQRTNQIAGFVTVPLEKKLILFNHTSVLALQKRISDLLKIYERSQKEQTYLSKKTLR